MTLEVPLAVMDSLEEDFELTKESLGAPKKGRSEELDALAAFVASHRSTPKSPYRQDGTLTESAKKGSELFKQLTVQLAIQAIS